MTPTMHHAGVLWRYLTACGAHHADGLLVVCGSYDLRVCDHACDLFRHGCYERLLITGRTGNWTNQIWTETEAQVFAARARANGISTATMILEEEATNFAENIRYARRLVPDVQRVTFVTKLNSVRRVLATAPLQWPGADVRAAGPQIAFPDGVSNIVGVFGLIEEMVGDIDRMIRYPALGYQIETQVPNAVRASSAYLAGQGFDRHLVAPAVLLTAAPVKPSPDV